VHYALIWQFKLIQFNLQLREAVSVLASNLPEPPRLKGERLADLMESMMTQHFFTPVLQDLRLRQMRDKLHQVPHLLICSFYRIIGKKSSVFYC
jgi:hypothetical protein